CSRGGIAGTPRYRSLDVW
nr:immunoglobulin heavy chain junction region [Macaca mulatta]